MADSPTSTSLRSMTLLIGLALTMAFTTACNGKQDVKDDALTQQRPLSHLDLVTADATLVISAQNIVERARTIRDSRAFDQFKGIIENLLQDPEISEGIKSTDDVMAVLEKHLKGRASLVVYDRDKAQPDGERDSEFLIILDADVQALTSDLRKLSDASPSQFVSLGEGMVQMVDDDPESPDDFFLFQAGPTGFITSEKGLLSATIAQAQSNSGENRLTDDLSYKGLTKDLKHDKDLFIWVRDWTQGDEWSDMLGGATGQPLSRSIAAVVDLSEGVDVTLEMELNPDDFDDPTTKAFLPALTEVEAAPTIPNKLPSDSLAYMGLNVSVEVIIEMLKQEGMFGDMPSLEDKQMASMVEAFLASFEGEFGLAVTSESMSGIPSAEFGVPIPGFVFVARLTSAEASKTLRPMMEFALSALQEGPDPMLHSPKDAMLGDNEITFYKTSDPGVVLGFTIAGEYLVIGNPEGMSDALPGLKGGKGAGLTSSLGFSAIGESLGQKSNYQMHLNLAAIYDVVRKQFAMQLGLFTGGTLGGRNDALTQFFSVFHYAGGSVTFKGDRARARFYLTAEDLPKNQD